MQKKKKINYNKIIFGSFSFFYAFSHHDTATTMFYSRTGIFGLKRNMRFLIIYCMVFIDVLQKAWEILTEQLDLH